MKIGNIVTDKIKIFDQRIETVDSIDNIIDGIPTMIIGWNNVKVLYPNTSILEKQISENIFWTFSLIEKRKTYENDIESFIQYCYNKSVVNLKYVFIDPIQFNVTMIKKVLSKLYSHDDIYSYKHNNNIYMYADNIIFCVDIHLCEFYFNINKNKIIDKISKHSKNFSDGEDILIKYKDYLIRLGSVKYIPYLQYNESKNNINCDIY